LEIKRSIHSFLKLRTICFCGNSYGLYGKSIFCNVSCGGNASEICGGSQAKGQFANDVYITDLGNVYEKI